MIKDQLEIVPPQFDGKEISIHANKTCKSETDAKLLYEQSKKRLLDVNSWDRIAGVVTAKFQIVDEHGHEVGRAIQKHDFIKINIPGPGSKEGDGYDWVRVEELKEVGEGSRQSIGFRVRPTDNPFSEKNETAHFYSQEATSSFIISRDGRQISTSIIDRNLQPNTEAGSLVDKVRDMVVGVSAIAGFSKVQWQGLADGLVGNSKF